MKKTLLILLAMMIGMLSSKSQVPPYVPVNGLIAWYPFNGNADDASTNALHGTVNGAIPTTDRFMAANSAFYFNNNYISVPSNVLFNTGAGLTVSAWVNLTSPNLDQKIIGRTNTSFNSGFVLGVQNNEAYPEVWDNAGTHYTFNAGVINTGAWEHLVMTWTSGGYFIVYVNGIAADSIAASTNPVGANSEPLIIGVSPWSQSPTYLAAYGILDDMGIWDRALSASEVLVLYQSVPQGINDISSDQHWVVFPNPSSEDITIRFTGAQPVTKYQVNDVAGRIMLTGQLGITSEISIINLPAGVYFLNLDSMPVRTCKIVKLASPF